MDIRRTMRPADVLAPWGVSGQRGRASTHLLRGTMAVDADCCSAVVSRFARPARGRGQIASVAPGRARGLPMEQRP